MPPAPHQARADRHGRRWFLRRIGGIALQAAAVWAVLMGLIRLRTPQGIPQGARRALGIVRPPGALGESDFLAACIRCTRCADACSVGAIKLFGAEAGSMQGTPYLDPINAACNMCLACGPACPTEALLPLLEVAEVEMGEATVDDRLCVSINGTGVCGACFTACPLRGEAITQGIRNAPEVHEEHCTGCGLCEQFCIVDEREGLRAIQVTTDRRWDHAEAAA